MKIMITYNPEQAAEAAGVTRRTIYQWIKSGHLPAHKTGPKLWVIYRGVLDAFMGGRDVEQAAADIAAQLDAKRARVAIASEVKPIERPKEKRRRGRPPKVKQLELNTAASDDFPNAIQESAAALAGMLLQQELQARGLGADQGLKPMNQPSNKSSKKGRRR